MDVVSVEFTLEERENTVGGDVAAYPLDGIERRSAVKELPRRTTTYGSQPIHDLSGKLSEVRKPGSSLRYASSAEKDYFVPVAGEQEVVRNRWSIRDESHLVDKARVVTVVEVRMLVGSQIADAPGPIGR